MNMQETQKKFGTSKRISSIKLPHQSIYKQDGQYIQQNQSQNYESLIKKNMNIKINEENIEKHLGYEMSLKITKENSFDEAYKDKLIQFINKFYFNGQFQLTLYFPHRLGQRQQDELSQEFKSLQFQMKEIEIEKSDYLFYQKIYQFQGQEKFEISADLQMLIFDQSVFQDLESKVKIFGYPFQCNFQTLQCSIPIPNNIIHDIKEEMQFFINNVQNQLDSYDIIPIDTQTKQKSHIYYKLVKKNQHKIQDKLKTKIFPVLINLNKLQPNYMKQLGDNFIFKIQQTLQHDKLYLVVEKTNKDLSLIKQEFKNFMDDKNNIIYQNYEKQIQFKEPQESEFLEQQLENLQIEFQNISIQVSLPKLINMNQYEVQIQCETWHDPQVNPFNFREDCNLIQKKLFQIYNPHVQIRMKDQQKIQIWQEYLKSQLDKQLILYITEENKRSNHNENQNDFLIKISTNLPQYEEEQKRIKQHLENYQLSTVEIQNDNLQLQSFIVQYINKNEFEKILNNFQKQQNAKIAQIKLLAILEQKFQFKIIYYNKYSRNEIEDVIKSQLINDLKLYLINFPFISIINYLKLEIPKQIQDKDILSVIPNENKQQVIVIGRNQDLLKFQDITKEIEKKYFDNRMKIQLFIKQKSLSDEIFKKMKQQDFCHISYDQKRYIQTIEFFKQDLEIICNHLKTLEQSYETCKVLILDDNDQKINLKEIEKKDQVIIDIQSLSIINPLIADGFLLNVGDNKQIKFIQGNISQIQCQAIVIEFLKNVDFSQERLQNDQIKNIINFIQGENNKKQLLYQWKYQSQEQELEDINCLKLQNHKTQIDYLFQIYPKFYRQASNLGSNLQHIKSLITQVFQLSKDYNIIQIAFPLIGVGLFGYSLKDIQQVVIQEIISQLSDQNCQISQVYVVIQNEQDYKQVQEYCKTISNNINLNQTNHRGQSFDSTQVPCCQIEIDGDLIDIEDWNVIELINQKYQLLKQGEQIEPFTITHPYSKYPFTHSIDLKNNKMIQKKTKTQSTIQFIDLFKQRIYFIDYQQVSQSLNQYLILKHEQSKLNEFEIYYSQDEVKVINSQLYIKTNASDKFKKIIIKYKKDQFNSLIREIPIIFQQTDQQAEKVEKNDLKWQLEILSDNEQKIKRAIESINQRKI